MSTRLSLVLEIYREIEEAQKAIDKMYLEAKEYQESRVYGDDTYEKMNDAQYLDCIKSYSHK